MMLFMPAKMLEQITIDHLRGVVGVGSDFQTKIYIVRMNKTNFISLIHTFVNISALIRKRSVF